MKKNAFDWRSQIFLRCIRADLDLIENEFLADQIDQIDRMFLLQMVRLLLREGASVDVTDKHGQTPLHWAAYMGHDDVIVDLVQAGANVNVVDAQVRYHMAHCLSVCLSVCLCLNY